MEEAAEGDPTGPLFLTPGLVIAMHVTEQSFRPEQKIELKRYLLSKRRKEGGWGLCVPSSTVDL